MIFLYIILFCSFDHVVDTKIPVDDGTSDGCFISTSYDATRFFCFIYLFFVLFLKGNSCALHFFCDTQICHDLFVFLKLNTLKLPSILNHFLVRKVESTKSLFIIELSTSSMIFLIFLKCEY